tara:strand:- start:165 stop:521 length:357 start_codon:yes stop_codon:yes gene_type:complete
MRRIFCILLGFSISSAAEPVDVDSIVYHQMLLLKSKMDINPIIWQDTKEGYTRNRAVRVCNKVLDSLGKIDTETLVEQNYPLLDSLLLNLKKSAEYQIEHSKSRNYQFNYFYSSSSKP